MYSCQSRDGGCKWGWAIGVQLLYSELCTAPLNDWQLFCWVEEEQRTEAGIPSGKPVVSARSFYIWFPYLFFFFSLFPPLCVSKHEAQKILSTACFTNTQPCQLSRLPRPHQQKIRLFLLSFPPPFSSKYMPLFRKAQDVSALREF